MKTPVKVITIRLLTMAVVISSILFLASYPVSPVRSATSQTTTFIDVGQGDSILIQDGMGFDALIDGGIVSQGVTVDQFLKDHGAMDLEIMLASHADADHIGGLIAVLNDPEITIHSVLYNGYEGDTKTWDKFKQAVSDRGLTLTPIQFPSIQTWGGMTVYILNPAAGLSNPKTNAASIVLRMDYGGTRELFTGDIDVTIEATIIARQTPVTADVLKVPHHGSASSSSVEFIAAVQPTFAVISVGEKNNDGHPSPETLARLQSAGIVVYRTDQQWSVTASSDGVAVAISTPNIQLFYLPIIQK